MAAFAKSLIFCAGLLFLPALLGADTSDYSRVQASHAALQAVQRDYQARKRRGSLSTTEDSDYQVYIAQLRKRFLEACAELDAVASQQFAPCGARSQRAGSAAPIDQAAERTADERTMSLQRELDASLSEFDEMLLVEQERVKAATPPPSASDADGTEDSGNVAGVGGGNEGASGAADDQGSEVDAEQGRASTAAVDRRPGESRPGSPSGDGGGKQAGVDGIPEDIADGSDDDVVARQLREAAMQETDPELRARLWEEYRRYKRGSR